MNSLFKLLALFFCLSGIVQPGTINGTFALSYQNSIISMTKYNFGGYGGPHFKLTTINGKFTMIGGGPIAVLIDPKLAVFISSNYLEGDVEGIVIGYGGIGAERTFFLNRKIRLGFNGQIGYGLASDEQDQSVARSSCLVFEPEFFTSFCITESERIKLGAGYRWVTGIHDLPSLSNNDFCGFYGIVQLYYGIFDIQRRQEFLKSKDHFNIFSGTYSIKFTHLNHQFIILDGGGTRFILNRKYAIGVGGYRSIKSADYNGNELSTGYGGLWAHYILSPMNKVHFSFSSLIAIGGAGYVDEKTDKTIEKAMFVLEPDVFLDFNITKFMRIGLGTGYRLMLGRFEQLDTWDMSSFSATLQVRFGGF